MGLFNKFFRATKKSVKVVAEQVEVKGKVLPHLLNVRKRPKLTAPIVGQVVRNQIVNIVNDLGQWYEIVWDKHSTAYVYKKYILIIAYIKRGEVTANILNVRAFPSKTAEIVGRLRKGQIVFVVEQMPGWYGIDYNGRVAYVAQDYILAHDLPPIGGLQAISTFFYQRPDLQNYPLEPEMKVTVPQQKTATRTAALAWNNYGGLMNRISLELGIEVEASMAIICVEGGGRGFDDNGRLIIRFENHVFWQFYGKFHPDTFNAHFRFDHRMPPRGHQWRKSTSDPWQNVHTSQDTEWAVFEFASKLDKTAAMKSISMGAPQIMGFNYKTIGYNDVQTMFDNFKKDIRYHLFALFDFAKAVPRRILYLQKKDFYNFAREYNGSANPREYERRLLEFYHIFKHLL